MIIIGVLLPPFLGNPGWDLEYCTHSARIPGRLRLELGLKMGCIPSNGCSKPS